MIPKNVFYPGDFCKKDGKIIRVGSNHPTYDMATLEPIELTPEFYKKCNQDQLNSLDSIRVHISDKVAILWVDNNKPADIEYLHQLQAFYKSSTGKELEVNITPDNA